jgi:hypothetical protein
MRDGGSVTVKGARRLFAGGPPHTALEGVVIEYLNKMPKRVPLGKLLVHNAARPTRRLGSGGFRAWLQEPGPELLPCFCDWAPELPVHYRRSSQKGEKPHEPVDPSLITHWLADTAREVHVVSVEFTCPNCGTKFHETLDAVIARRRKAQNEQ